MKNKKVIMSSIIVSSILLGSLSVTNANFSNSMGNYGANSTVSAPDLHSDEKDRMYIGGTPNFDERTGKYIDKEEEKLKKLKEQAEKRMHDAEKRKEMLEKGVHNAMNYSKKKIDSMNKMMEYKKHAMQKELKPLFEKLSSETQNKLKVYKSEMMKEMKAHKEMMKKESEEIAKKIEALSNEDKIAYIKEVTAKKEVMMKDMLVKMDKHFNKVKEIVKADTEAGKQYIDKMNELKNAHKNEMQEKFKEKHDSIKEKMNIQEMKEHRESVRNELKEKRETFVKEGNKKLEETKNKLIDIRKELHNKELTKEQREELIKKYKDIKENFNKERMTMAADYKSMKKDNIDKVQNIQKQIVDKRADFKSKYAKIFKSKFQKKLNSFSIEKLELINKKIDTIVAKYEKKTNISQEKKDKLLGQIDALKLVIADTIKEKSNSTEDDILSNELGNLIK